VLQSGAVPVVSVSVQEVLQSGAVPVVSVGVSEALGFPPSTIRVYVGVGESLQTANVAWIQVSEVLEVVRVPVWSPTPTTVAITAPVTAVPTEIEVPAPGVSVPSLERPESLVSFSTLFVMFAYLARKTRWTQALFATSVVMTVMSMVLFASPALFALGLLLALVSLVLDKYLA